MNEMTTYKRVWMYRHRHKPEQLATNEHRKLFRIMFTYWKQGKCHYCGILKAESPNHNCIDIDLNEENVEEFVARLFSEEGL